MKGRLPWQDYKAWTKKEKYDRILEKKVSLSLELLCSKLPEEFFEYMKYVYSLEFEQKPDYASIDKLFNDMIRKYSTQGQANEFEWNVVA